MTIKAIAGPRMSLLTFTVAQGVIDFEVIYRILNHLPHPHGMSHTFLGAVVLAGLTVGVTVPVARLATSILRLPTAQFRLSWSAAWCGALLGTCSHVVLDSIMHPDVHPFWPLTRVSPLYGLLSIPSLHELCFWTGSLGLIAWAVSSGYRRWTDRKPAALRAPPD